MNKLLTKMLLTGLIVSSINTADAAVHNFTITGGYTMDITTTGNWNTTMDPDTGALASAMDLNFAIVTNDPNPVTTMGLTACTMNASSTESVAIKSTDFTPDLTTTTARIIFAEQGAIAGDCATDAAIQNCCSVAATPSENPNAVSYPSSLTIDNGGSFTYVEGGDRHFDLNINPTVQADPTNLHLTLSTGCCPGVYDCDLANDTSGTYEVEICLTGIPSI